MDEEVARADAASGKACFTFMIPLEKQLDLTDERTRDRVSGYCT